MIPKEANERQMNLEDSGVVTGPFVEISAEARVGRGCVLGSHCHVRAGAVLGERVRIEGGVVVPGQVVIEDDASVGANVVFAQPEDGEAPGVTVVRRGARLGGNATIAAGVTIGEEALVKPGAVVVASVQPHAIVAGNPARVTGFRGARSSERGGEVGGTAPEGGGHVISRVRGVRVVTLPFISDPRGNLTVGEFERSIPFRPRRYFITFDVPNARMRGEHAHRECEQFLVCVRGSCAVVVDDGEQREEILLDRPTLGVHVPPLVWATEYKHTSDSTLMVFASHYYDPDDYIRDYGEFLALAREGRVGSAAGPGSESGGERAT